MRNFQKKDFHSRFLSDLAKDLRRGREFGRGHQEQGLFRLDFQTLEECKLSSFFESIHALSNFPACIMTRPSRRTVGARISPSRWLETATFPPMDLLSPKAMCTVPITFSSSKIKPVICALSFVPMPSSA